jgi:hypothetical protein
MNNLTQLETAIANFITSIDTEHVLNQEEATFVRDTLVQFTSRACIKFAAGKLKYRTEFLHDDIDPLAENELEQIDSLFYTALQRRKQNGKT